LCCLLISQGKEHLLLLSFVILSNLSPVSKDKTGKMEREVTQVVAIERWITQSLAYYLPNKLHNNIPIGESALPLLVLVSLIKLQCTPSSPKKKRRVMVCLPNKKLRIENQLAGGELPPPIRLKTYPSGTLDSTCPKKNAHHANLSHYLLFSIFNFFPPPPLQ